MAEWRDVHRPDLPWAPSGLPGWLKAMPGSVARLIPEARLPLEIASLAMSPIWFDEEMPRGDGQIVLLVPGFGFGDPSVAPLHAVLRRFGYTTALSEIVANVRCSDRTVDTLAEVAEALVERSGGRRIALVGHSRGGMIGRGLGARRPDLIARVVSLGAPINDEAAFYEIPRPMLGLIRAVDRFDAERNAMGCLTPDCACPYMQLAHRPIPEDVELVSIYSRQDGVVDWRSCHVAYGRNVEVHCSHMGMGSAPEAMRAVLHALARPLPAAGVPVDLEADEPSSK